MRWPSRPVPFRLQESDLALVGIFEIKLGGIGDESHFDFDGRSALASSDGVRSPE